MSIGFSMLSSACPMARSVEVCLATAFLAKKGTVPKRNITFTCTFDVALPLLNLECVPKFDSFVVRLAVVGARQTGQQGKACG